MIYCHNDQIGGYLKKKEGGYFFIRGYLKKGLFFLELQQQYERWKE